MSEISTTASIVRETPTYLRTLRCFRKQRGKCWVCGYPMLPPAGNGKNPNRFHATLDHLAPRNSGYSINKPRPVKAAHRMCNNVRHHNDTVPKSHLRAVRSIMGKSHWRIVFGNLPYPAPEAPIANGNSA